MTTQAQPTITDYQTALEAGDIQEALRLANLIDFVELAPKIEKPVINTIAADNATGWKAQKASRIERMILDSQESTMHDL